MLNIIPQYKQFSNITKENIGLKYSQFRVFYFDKNDIFIISKDINPSNGIILLGQDTDWNTEIHNLQINLEIVIEDPSNISGSNGIISDKAKAGIALEWTSSSSGQRGLSNHVLLDPSKSEPLEATFNLQFFKNQFRGIVDLNLIFYLAEEDQNYSGPFANTKGMVLGSPENSVKLVFDGSGSLFPIKDILLESDGPLWKMKYDCTDPYTDKFDENSVCLMINRNHHDYLQLQNDDPASSSSLWCEVVSSWIFQLFMSIKLEHPDSLNYLAGASSTADTEPQSVMDWLMYLVNVHDLNLTSTAELQASINKIVYSKLRYQ